MKVLNPEQGNEDSMKAEGQWSRTCVEFGLVSDQLVWDKNPANAFALAEGTGQNDWGGERENRRTVVPGMHVLFLFLILISLCDCTQDSEDGFPIEQDYYLYDFKTYDTGKAVIETSEGNILVAGITSSGFKDLLLLFELDEVFDEKWHQTFDLGGEIAVSSLIQTICGDFLIIGTYSGPPYQSIVIRCTVDGNVLWYKLFLGDEYDSERGRYIYETNDGFIVISFCTYGLEKREFIMRKLREDGTMLWQRLIDFRSLLGSNVIFFDVSQCSNSEFVFVGSVIAEPLSQFRHFSGKLNDAGEILWLNFFGTEEINSSVVIPISIVKSSGDGYAVMLVGSSTYLVKLDNNGNEVWYRDYDLRDYWGNDLIAKKNGGYLITGQTRWDVSPDYNRSDVFIINTDRDGTMLERKLIGGEFRDVGYSIVETKNRGFVIAGESKKKDNSTDVLVYHYINNTYQSTSMIPAD